LDAEPVKPADGGLGSYKWRGGAGAGEIERRRDRRVVGQRRQLGLAAPRREAEHPSADRDAHRPHDPTSEAASDPSEPGSFECVFYF
jgi:hypothetical protein